MKQEKQEITAYQAPTPSTLLSMALEKGVSMDQLKELMDLQERWEKKEAKKAFLDALSKFQTMVPTLKKNRVAKINSQKGAYSYKYSDLGSIAKGISKALHECGLSYRWDFEEKNGLLKVNCNVSHREGHTETTSMEAGKDNSGFKNDIQQKGSTQTYLQRYTLIGALGLSTADEDNDGKTFEQPAEEKTDEEILDLWQQKVNEAKTRIELKSIYLKEKKKIDSDPKIQAIFSTRRNELPETQKKEVVLP